MTERSKPQLSHSLGPVQLWAIAVGLVISGEYFGWSYGWASAGTLGFLIATIFVALMYLALIFSYTELTTAMPKAGGPFVYVSAAFGRRAGLIAGYASAAEFIFAPPAIALAIGSYLHVQFPALPPKAGAVVAYLLFMGVNIAGIQVAASFELIVTIAAIVELLVFMGVVWPGFSWHRFVMHGWGGSDHLSWAVPGGIAASIPFAIWFFLAIEGVALTAEEARSPRRTLPIAYTAAILTLVGLSFGVMILAGGVGDWRELSNLNDPLPLAMKTVVGPHSPYLHMLVWLGLFGLVASLHAIIMGCARQIAALAQGGGLPRWMGLVSPRFHTPYAGVLVCGTIGILAIFSDDILSFGGESLTASIVTISVFGALTMYIMTMASLFRLRKIAPDMPRFWHAPGYPVVPAYALMSATLCLGVISFQKPLLLGFYVVIIALMTGGSFLSDNRTKRSQKDVPVFDPNT
ncbi:ethanolamine permease [Gluconobacter sp. Dm-62]|uniref:ethanolamine permease n=1 Tax=Gluconobacter sp. Dm-62 TaxID=2799804 RepID=UPI001B8AAB0C|nr:ethanolamine permease [Gluconobacter sp. Dm-62]MBS1101430.1 ethanolamine permease [Gluconobacter sp. Dm-62]